VDDKILDLDKDLLRAGLEIERLTQRLLSTQEELDKLKLQLLETK
jgi:hypothetical protein